MKRKFRWIYLSLFIAAWMLTACGIPTSNTPKTQPSRLETIEGSAIKRVILNEKAAERLALQTALVKNGQVERTILVGGEVVENPMAASSEDPTPNIGSNSYDTWVVVNLNASELVKVDRTKPARILPASLDRQAPGWQASEIEVSSANVSEESEGENRTLYYVIKDMEQALEVGQQVGVEFAQAGNGMKRIVIPYSALIYTPDGDTWVYTNSEPLVFLRRPVTVDYIVNDFAYLVVGPPSGTKVVTVGAAELFGAETGVSK